jgi:hypothetical protein
VTPILLWAGQQAAQSPKTGDPVTQGLGRLTWEYGVLGIICVLLIGALVWVVKRWQAAMQDKVDITKTYADSLKEQNDAATGLIVETNRNNDTLKVAFDGLKSEVNGRQNDLNKVEEAIDELKLEQTKFIAAAGKAHG